MHSIANDTIVSSSIAMNSIVGAVSSLSAAIMSLSPHATVLDHIRNAERTRSLGSLRSCGERIASNDDLVHERALRSRLFTQSTAWFYVTTSVQAMVLELESPCCWPAVFTLLAHCLQTFGMYANLLLPCDGSLPNHCRLFCILPNVCQAVFRMSRRPAEVGAISKRLASQP